MTSLGFSSVPGNSQILQPVSGGANPANSHFTNAYGSIVGGVTGCGGAGGSAAALAGKSGYNTIAAKQHGGKTHRRGGYKKRGQSKRRGGQSKRRSCKCRGKCHCKGKKHARCTCRGACHCKRSNKRTMRGGLSAFLPASFSGANPPYHQYMGNVPASNNFSVGAESLSPAMSGMATPGPITVFSNCAPQ